MAAEYTTLGISGCLVERDKIYTEDEQNLICDNCNGAGCAMCANPNCPECHGKGCVHSKNVELGEAVVTPPEPDPGPWPGGSGIPPDSRCPFCGYLTCNGSCREEKGEEIPSPPPEDCPEKKCIYCGGIIPGTAIGTRSTNACSKCELK